MAVLGNKNGVNAEILFTKREGSYIYYSFRFFYGKESLFNPSILEWDNVECDEYREDSFIPFLEGVLQTDKPTVWVGPLEGEILVEAVPRRSVDWFEFTFTSDKQLNQETSPSLSELAVRITVEKEELEKFIRNLKAEYMDFWKGKQAQ